MGYLTQSTQPSLERDFGSKWSNRLSTTITSTPELVIIEQEAWKNQVNFRDSAPDTPRSVDPWGLLTSPATPRKGSYRCVEENEEDEDGEEDDGIAYAGNHYALGEKYDLWQWALVKYDHSYQDIRRGKMHRLEIDWEMQSFVKKIVFYVFLALVFHGIWTHWDESKKGDACSCYGPKHAVKDA